MANRNNHYEAAFEAYLRAQGIPYIATDEARRSVLESGETIKNLDFIVSAVRDSTRWLIDVKGRRFPSGAKHRQYWKNWSTGDDLEALRRWEALFGEGFSGLLLFAFDVIGDKSPLPADRLFHYRDHLYAFLAVGYRQYLDHARTLSRRWDTVGLSAKAFRHIARPFEEFL